MKEAVVFIPGYGAYHQNTYLDDLLVPGLLTQLEDVNLRLDPEEVKIPGQMGKRFHCQLEDSEKIIDIFEVYWDDLVDNLSSKGTRHQFFRGLYINQYWIFHAWKIASKSFLFFIQMTVALSLVAAWSFGVIIIIFSAISEQTELVKISFWGIGEFLQGLEYFATDGIGWSVWVLLSFILAFSPISTNFVVDFVSFYVMYCQNESDKGKPPLRGVLRSRLKISVDNVLNEASYDQITILAHSIGSLIATDYLGDYSSKEDVEFRYITWGSPLESTALIADWMAIEIQRCLRNPHVKQWDDFYSHQDWLCCQMSKSRVESSVKFSSKEASFRVSIAKQITAEAHVEYFFDSKVLRHLVLGILS